jgi:predicted dithiol-disulfide oxidoreductase (DUF899 family)
MSDEWWTQLKSVTLHTDADVAQVWPVGASAEYTAARTALLEAEQELRDRVEEVAAMRRSLPAGVALPPYIFAEGPRDLELDQPLASPTLVDLFGEHESLVAYHLMFHPDDDEACAMCSLWVDGLHGVSHHLDRRTAFVVIGKAPIEKLRRWARHRGWDGLRIVSSFGTTFNTDLSVETPNGGQWPAVSVFTRNGDTAHHRYTQCADFPDHTSRGIDLLSPVWNVFDLLPEGRDDWLPDNAYPGRDRG